MSQKIVLKFLSVFTICVTLTFFSIGVYFAHKFYKNIFRLLPNQINASLNTTVPKCKKLIDCKLLPGDILIRRYITKRTWIVNKLFHPYFTHSAFYLGDNQSVEAIGTEKNSKDDIQIITLSKSDWLNFDLSNFVVIRPKKYFSKLDFIKIDLKQVAEDPDYTFGLPEQGYKRTTCADLIFTQLSNRGVIQVSNQPNIITPDYLFWLAVNNPADFEIVGYNIRP